MKLAALLTISFLLMTTDMGFGQPREIVGRILDYETQQPIKNANIIISGTTLGSVSNFLGYFQLNVGLNNYTSIIVSHIGYQTSEIPLPAEDRFKFFLQKKYQQLSLLNLNLYPQNNLKGVDGRVSRPFNGGITLAESDALYEGGIEMFYNYIGNYLVEVVDSLPKNGVNVLFSIDESGRAVNLEVLNASEYFRETVKAAFDQMPSWIPATQQQQNTIQHFLLPIDKINTVENTSPILDGFYSFVSQTINYPAPARRMGVQGIVNTEFEINSMGEIINSTVLMDIGGECGNEVKRVIMSLPREQLKLLVQVTGFNTFVLPVAFGLQVPYKGNSSFQHNSAYLLKEVPVVAVGIEREVRVTGGDWKGYSRKKFNSGYPYHREGAFIFRNLPDALVNPRYVTRLELANRGLSLFPADILRLKNLEVLDLEKNSLQELPNSFDEIPRLKELYLFGNRISSLPESFRILRKLKTLGLASNEFECFPELICSLENVELLDLSENNISTLPDNIGQLKKLKVIVLRNNRISKIPESFYSLNNLEQISLEGNLLDLEDKTRLKSEFGDIQLVLE